MFGIGEFSKLTGLTVKTLRFYHERNLLVPTHVDEENGYRFYNQKNLETARALVALKDLGFSLIEISEILREYSDESDLLNILEQKKQTLTDQIARNRDLLSQINQLIKTEREARRMSQAANFEVHEKSIEPQIVGGIRMKGNYNECGKVFGKLGRSLGWYLSGPALCLIYDTEYRENDADFEPCMPIRKLLNREGIDIRELPGGRAVTLIHQGPYSEISRSYERIFNYIKEKGFETQLPTREVYLKGPGMIFRGNPKNYLTEIQILVK